MTSEESLVRQSQAGDRMAFRSLYELYKDNVYTYCYHLLNRDREETNDAVQEAFVRAFEKIGDLDHEGSFRSWLFVIVRNHVLDRLVARGKMRAVRVEDVEQELREPDGPDVLFERSERHSELRSAMALLSPEYREVVLLRDFEGMTYHEIAALLRLTEGAVRARLFKARRKLSKLLGAAMEGRG